MVAGSRWPKRKGKISVGDQHLAKKGGWRLTNQGNCWGQCPRPENLLRGSGKQGGLREELPRGQTDRFGSNVEPRRSRDDSLRGGTWKGKGKRTTMQDGKLKS